MTMDISNTVFSVNSTFCADEMHAASSYSLTGLYTCRSTSTSNQSHCCKCVSLTIKTLISFEQTCLHVLLKSNQTNAIIDFFVSSECYDFLGSKEALEQIFQQRIGFCHIKQCFY